MMRSSISAAISSSIDSANYGDGSGPGERSAAEYVAEKLAEVDLQPEIFESGPGRASVIVVYRATIRPEGHY